MLALAVIGIPMLFDSPPPAALTELSDRPMFDADASLDAAEASLAASEPVAPPEELIPTEQVVAQVEALRDEVDEEGFRTDNGVQVGVPVLQPVSEATSAFAVQSGSFAQLDNARGLRAKLREMGHEAFLSPIKVADGTVMHRVAVGPFLDRTDAEALIDSLAAAAIEGQLVEMTL